jgi:molybdopterin molybdotransferase
MKNTTKSLSLGLQEALRLTLESIAPLPGEEAPLLDSIGRIAASDLSALVDSPPTDSSRKDGYALNRRELAAASPEAPARFRVIGSMVAGGNNDLQIEPGTTVRVLTGARIPAGADVVVAEEYTRLEGGEVLIDDPTVPEMNILPRGGDVAAGTPILRAGGGITPIMAGLLAAAGHSTIPVFRKPLVGILGTGDEIVEPGKPLGQGKLYASNIVTLAGLCHRYQMQTRVTTAKDDRDAILDAMRMLAGEVDALITSGGAWKSDRDLVPEILDELGWRKVFHRIRMGPGKAVGFGLLGQKPVFILPGGPPSNLMGFLQIGLPGLQTLAGWAEPGLPRINARLAAEIQEGKAAWTDFFYGTLEPGEDLPAFHPMKKRVRLHSISQAKAVASIPEGMDTLPAGTVVNVQLLP